MYTYNMYIVCIHKCIWTTEIKHSSINSKLSYHEAKKTTQNKTHLSHWEKPAYNKHVPMESTHSSHLFRELTVYSKLPDADDEL